MTERQDWPIWTRTHIRLKNGHWKSTEWAVSLTKSELIQLISFDAEMFMPAPRAYITHLTIPEGY